MAPQQAENLFKESQFIEQIIVIGENRRFTAAIIVPDFVFLHNWCTIHHVKFRDNDDLIRNKKVIDRYQREIDKFNPELDNVAQIKVFKLVTDNWTSENGMLSPTQKLKRKVIKNNYSKLIEDIYK